MVGSAAFLEEWGLEDIVGGVAEAENMEESAVNADSVA
jgi:hypothetical protein